jgi:hypothetical protein
MTAMLLDFSKIDIRDDDLSLAIDLIKNQQSKEALDKEDPDAESRLDSWFRVWTMLLEISASLREFNKRQN